MYNSHSGPGVPADLLWSQIHLDSDLEDSRNELETAIWFVSLLTRVDGLVLMTPSFDVRGFGVEITYDKAPKAVFRWSDNVVNGNHLSRASYKHFGTRHRSMMRYCAQNPNSVGFVISQDGDVRAMTQMDGKLVLWENIRLQLYNPRLPQESLPLSRSAEQYGIRPGRSFRLPHLKQMTINVNCHLN
jgi:hypothetical protein